MHGATMHCHALSPTLADITTLFEMVQFQIRDATTHFHPSSPKLADTTALCETIQS